MPPNLILAFRRCVTTKTSSPSFCQIKIRSMQVRASRIVSSISSSARGGAGLHCAKPLAYMASKPGAGRQARHLASWRGSGGAKRSKRHSNIKEEQASQDALHSGSLRQDLDAAGTEASSPSASRTLPRHIGKAARVRGSKDSYGRRRREAARIREEQARAKRHRRGTEAEASSATIPPSLPTFARSSGTGLDQSATMYSNGSATQLSGSTRSHAASGQVKDGGAPPF